MFACLYVCVRKIFTYAKREESVGFNPQAMLESNV